MHRRSEWVKDLKIIYVHGQHKKSDYINSFK